MIKTILKCVLLMCSLNLHFLFNGDTELKRMSSIVKVMAHVLSDKRDKYSVVGTRPPKNNTFSNSADSEGHLRENSFRPSPRQCEIFFLFFHESIFLKILS